MPVYRPRMVARLMVPNVGEPAQRTRQEDLDDVTQLQVRVHRAHLECNNHNEADVCEISCSYDDAGIDPRILRNCELYLYMGDGDSKGGFVPSASNQRFVGIAVDVSRDFDESGGKNITIKALDYTTLFLEDGQFPATGVPDFSQTLTEAWNHLCDHTGNHDVTGRRTISTVERLKNRIYFVPTKQVDGGLPARDLRSLTVGAGLSARLAKLGKPSHKPDAWAVWQTIVGSLGLISFIRGDRVVVCEATDFYTGDDPPRFIYGKNIKRIKESRHTQGGKPICIRSLNPLTMQTIETFWPPLGDSRSKPQKRLGASAQGAPQATRSESYESFDCPLPVTDPAILERFAQLVWEQRSRQELKGELTTAEMFVDTLGAVGDDGVRQQDQVFDLLALQAGDRIRVELDTDALTWIQRLKSVGARVAALHDRGYSAEMASFIVRNLDGINSLTPEFQVHRVETTLDVSDPDGGSYEQTIEFVNRIDVSGSAAPGTGQGTSPMTNQVATTGGLSERQRNSRADNGAP